jgi:hypothetical protein
MNKFTIGKISFILLIFLINISCVYPMDDYNGQETLELGDNSSNKDIPYFDLNSSNESKRVNLTLTNPNLQIGVGCHPIELMKPIGLGCHPLHVLKLPAKITPIHFSLNFIIEDNFLINSNQKFIIENNLQFKHNKIKIIYKNDNQDIREIGSVKYGVNNNGGFLNIPESFFNPFIFSFENLFNGVSNFFNNLKIDLSGILSYII